MPKLTSKISFLAASLFFFIIEAKSQITYIPGPKPALSLRDIQTTPLDGEYLFKNVFAKEGNIKKWAFMSKNGRDTLKLFTDSLLPKFKNDIDDFINKDPMEDAADSEYLNYTRLKNIYEKIEALANKKIKDRAKSEFTTISNLIDALPVSKERIGLLLKFGKLNVWNTSYDQDVISKYNVAKSLADKIPDLYEKGKAYTHIGDFANYYQIYDSAISMYYQAKECFYNCNKDKKAKYLEEGIIDEKTGTVFEQQFLAQGYEKEMNYLLSAIDYFRASQNSLKTAESSSRYLAIWSYLLSDFDFYSSDILGSHMDRMEILKELGLWFDNYQSHQASSNNVDYAALYSIAQIFRAENKHQVALVYYIDAMFRALEAHNKNKIFNTLENIANVYALLKNEKLAIAYADLQIYFADKINDNWEYSNGLFRKARIYLDLNKYDSAIFYVNKVQYDKSFSSKFYPIVQDQLLKDVFELKYRTFDAIKHNSDSAWFYYDSYKDHQIEDLENYSYLVQTESTAIKEWLERIKNREISNETKLREAAQANELLAKERSRQDSIAKLQSDSISVLNQKITYVARDSTKQALDSASKEKKHRETVEALNEKISESNFQLKWGAGVLGAAALVIGFLYFMFRKTSKQLLISSTSDLQLRSAIKNHNLGNHYSKIKLMLTKNRVPEAVEYCQINSLYFDEYYKSLIKDIVTISEEINNFNSFIESERIFKKSDIKIIYSINNINPDLTVFLTDVFAPLYENVLLNGYIKSRNDYIFKIEISRQDSLLHIRIQDNGEGVNNIQSLIRPDSFLDLLQKRLRNYFKLKKIKIRESEVFSIESENNIGTTVKFKMPYETI